MHPHHWPPGERERLRGAGRIRGEEGGRERKREIESQRVREAEEIKTMNKRVNLGYSRSDVEKIFIMRDILFIFPTLIGEVMI